MTTTFHTGRDIGLSASNGGELEVTEDGIARAFTERFRDTFLYDHDVGKWYIWRGDCWEREVSGLALHHSRELAREASERLEERDQAKVRRASFATGAERLARADPAHAARQDEWDADPLLLACPDVTVDLRTGNVRPPAPEDRLTRRTSVAPADAAECPLWHQFLEQITGGDEGMMLFLQRWCGYGLTGLTREQALVFLYGPGGNGKSVFLNTIAGIMGDYATAAAMDTFTASAGQKHPTDLAMLRGARLVTASETEEGRAWAESRIKQMTGGDPITAHFMRQDNFTYLPQFKLMLVGNHAPNLGNVDDAMNRRFNMVPFDKKPEDEDRELDAKLWAEAPGILRWMIDGCLDWQANGLERPESIITATAEYFSEQDLLGQWAGEKCTIDTTNLHRLETSADLFKSWSDYAKAAGEDPGSARSFGGKLKRLGLQNDQQKIQGTNYKVWRGVTLISRMGNP